MLKKTVVIFAAAAFFGGAVSTQTAQARDYYYDDDDDWRYYQHRQYSPHWGPPYVQHPQVIVIQPEPETKSQNPETRVPE